ncbi:MAG TPA: hypothetical protein VFC99_11355 [Acidimicrobiia bacterium]|nr:hypothetical protein [Acidimicrobiia bacterium]
MALDPRNAARTAVLTPVGLGVLAVDATADWATAQGRKANAVVAPRVAPVRSTITTRVRSLLDEARTQAKPTASRLEHRLGALTRRRNGVGPAPKTAK